jgi:hypothetical protein
VGERGRRTYSGVIDVVVDCTATVMAKASRIRDVALGSILK